MWKMIGVYAVFINVLAFALFGIDKNRAKRHRWRISENVLLFTALLGGAPGALLGMRIFHHKTRHRRFTWGVPVILVLWGIVLVCAAGFFR